MVWSKVGNKSEFYLVTFKGLGGGKKKPCFTGVTDPDYPFWAIFFFFVLRFCKCLVKSAVF